MLGHPLWQLLLQATGIPWNKEHCYNDSRLQEGPAKADFVFFEKKKRLFEKLHQDIFINLTSISCNHNIRMFPVYPEMKHSKTSNTYTLNHIFNPTFGQGAKEHKYKLTRRYLIQKKISLNLYLHTD